MILVLASPPDGDLPADLRARAVFLPLATVPDVLEALAREPASAVVVPCPGSSINAFALARRLRDHPPVTLAGPLRLEQLFWAERNGCHCAPSLEAALQPATEKGS